MEGSKAGHMMFRIKNHVNSRSYWRRLHNWRSLRIDHRAMSRHPFSRCTGGMEGRPTWAYIWLKVGDSSARVWSTMGLTYRMGWSKGISWSGVTDLRIMACCTALPRIPISLQWLGPGLYHHSVIPSATGRVFQHPAKYRPTYTPISTPSMPNRVTPPFLLNCCWVLLAHRRLFPVYCRSALNSGTEYSPPRR